MEHFFCFGISLSLLNLIDSPLLLLRFLPETSFEAMGNIGRSMRIEVFV